MATSTEIWHVFTFEAAHRLPYVPKDHKCANMHGHSYRVQVHLEALIEEGKGWVRDFADIEAAFEPLRQQLDHHCLNEIEGLSNPTSENLARWIWNQLDDKLDELSAVMVSESAHSGCIYRG